MNVSITSPFGGVFYSQQEWDKNAIMGSDFDFNNPPAGMSVNDKGIKSISTEWGTKTARHYNVTYEEGGVPVNMLFWIKNGVVLRAEGSAVGMNLVIELTDTNIPEITG